MFAMAFPIPFESIRRSVIHPGPSLWAIAICVGIFPLVAWVVAQMFPAELAAGIIVLGATPTTLASAAVWTRRAGGNDVICLIATIATNGMCFVITPLWVYGLIGGDISPEQLTGTVVLLLWAVMVPIAIAQLLRALPRAANWATRHKIGLGVVAQFGILWVVFLGAIQAGLRIGQSESPLGWGVWGGLFVGLSALHLAIWWFAFQSSTWLGFQRPDRIAIGFASSQKTLMVGLAVALQLGFSVVPLVLYHILQLLIDTLIVGGLRKQEV